MLHQDSKIMDCARRALFCLPVVWAVAASGVVPVWTLKDGKTVAGSNVVFQDGVVTLTVTNPPGKITLPFAELNAPEKQQLLRLENTPYPAHAPAWLPGYRVRYPLRIADDMLASTSRTVIARLPTGGWLTTNAADIIVQTVTGRRLATVVLAHDPIGNTIVQFKRNGFDRWYWAYAMNANPAAADNPFLKQRAAEEAAKAAQLANVNAQKAAADAAGQLAKLNNEIALAQAAANGATNEALKSASGRTVAELTAKIQPATAVVTAAQAFAAQAAETARLAVEAHMKIMADTDPAVMREGLTVEFRQWSGDELVDWAAVAAGLHKSENILFNAIVPEVLQDVNPARRSDPLNFAASYRGFLRIEKPGVYRFFVNGDDAAYLFINGQKVYSRRGTNRPLVGSVPAFSIGADAAMEAGVHPFEIHHVVGNTPGAMGVCSFLWLPPGSNRWAFVPRSAFPEALVAVPATIEEAGGGQVADFQFGMEDTLSSDGTTLYLVRFEAQGNITQPDRLAWDFGDGTSATGRSATHIYFREGDYEVGLKSSDSLAPFRRRVNVWSAPLPTSPLSLGKAVEIFSGMDLARLDQARLNAMFNFLLICGQPARWPALEKLCRCLLDQKGLDIKYRVYIYTTLMEAVARQGRAAESMALMQKALAEVPRLKSLQVMIQLKAADIQRFQLKDYKEAGRLYEKVITENRRLRHPLLRQAAIARGDMFLETGDQALAGEAYRLATMMAGEGVAGEKAGDPATRGALLRVAEQQLKSGNALQSRRLLERIENEFPEQKLDGLYRFLRAEADRTSGRYDEAIRNYEYLLQLRQWAGYRAQSLQGIAESYYRTGDYAKTLEWLKGLKESFPDYYASKDLTNYQAVVEGMSRRRQELGGTQDMARVMFQELKRGFETVDGTNQSAATGFSMLASLGMGGGNTVFVSALPAPVNQCVLDVPLRNVLSEGDFWVEFWYRDTLASFPTVATPYVYVDFIGDNGQNGGRVTLQLEPTFGEWRKLATPLKAPVTKDGKVVFTIGNLLGIYEFGGLQIRPVSAQQNEALRTYIEGINPQ